MWVRRLSRHRFRPMAHNVTVYNVFFNDGSDGSSDRYIGTASTEAEAQTICDRYPDDGAWDPYYQIVPATSGETPAGDKEIEASNALTLAAWDKLVRASGGTPEEEPDVDDVLKLAAIIRKVDGNHDKGAAALAEAILAHPDSLWGRSKGVSGK